MKYYEDMKDKYGFSDGGGEPAEAQASRRVYITAINALAAYHNSSIRAVAYNRPGMHNSCMLIEVTVAFYDTLTPAQVNGDEDYDLPDSQTEEGKWLRHGEIVRDAGWQEAFSDCQDLNLDEYVVTTVTIDPNFFRDIVTWQASGVSVRTEESSS